MPRWAPGAPPHAGRAVSGFAGAGRLPCGRVIYANELSPWLIRAVAFVFGAAWGSFFNVAIYRWPREMSVVAPPSHCPACKAPIPWWRNVPIAGWLVLRGKAACCGARVSPRYLLVELLSAVLCVALAEQYFVRADAITSLQDAGLLTLVYFAFTGALVVATFVDVDFMEIPDEVTLPGAALGLATAVMRPEPGAAEAALGAGGGYLLVQLVFVWSYERLTGRRGMGEGDSKLLLMIGAFLGWRGAIFAIVAGALQGLVVAGIALASGKTIGPAEHREDEDDGEREDDGEHEHDSEHEPGDEPPPDHVGHMKVPYGPFLALGALEFLFFGDWIIDQYLGLFM